MRKALALALPTAPLGAASRWWLARSLRALDQSLQRLGQTLVLCRGRAAEVIASVARQTNAARVNWIASDIAGDASIEREVTQALEAIGVEARAFPSDLLAKPSSVRNKEGRGLRVFTPFWKRILSLGDPPEPLPAPKTLKAMPPIASDDLAAWNLEPTKPDWTGGLRETWTPGEVSAQTRLKEFLDHDIKGYTNLRDRPDRDYEACCSMRRTSDSGH